MACDCALSTDWLDRLMPMHVLLDDTGKILHAGPTLQKLNPDTDIRGRDFPDIFQLSRPRTETTYGVISGCAGKRLRLRYLPNPRIGFKALAVPVAGSNRLLVNLSFGIGAPDAVGEFSLTMGDFDPTDLTVEMLYLVEAKAAVMDELRRLNTRLQGAKIAAEEQAFTDTLTGLKNRRALDHVLGRYTQRGDPFGLMHIDLDYFKQVNDTLGHAAGDHVLQHVAEVLIAETRVDDTVARFGGDEFVIVFPRLTGRADLRGIATRIIEGLEAPIPFNGQDCRISASIGITASDDYDRPDAETMLKDADFALYASKHHGRAQATFFSREMRAGSADGSGDDLATGP